MTTSRGIFTTEFWFAVATFIVSVVFSFIGEDMNIDKEMTINLVYAMIAYIMGRSGIKIVDSLRRN